MKVQSDGSFRESHRDRKETTPLRSSDSSSLEIKKPKKKRPGSNKSQVKIVSHRGKIGIVLST